MIHHTVSVELNEGIKLLSTITGLIRACLVGVES